MEIKNMKLQKARYIFTSKQQFEKDKESSWESLFSYNAKHIRRQ